MQLPSEVPPGTRKILEKLIDEHGFFELLHYIADVLRAKAYLQQEPSFEVVWRQRAKRIRAIALGLQAWEEE